MTADRAAMLQRIQSAVRTAHLPGARGDLPAPAQPAGAAPTDLAASFTRELTAVRGQVHGPLPPAAALETVLALLTDSGGTEVLAWADADLPLPGLAGAARQAGFTLLDPTVPTDPDGRRAAHALFGQASAGLTGALAGLADTGSLVLTSGPGRPRLASLLPPMHIALLPTTALYPTLPAFFAAQPALLGDSSNLAIITGPSRTADIELTPVYGVHGPKVLHVILLSAPAP